MGRLHGRDINLSQPALCDSFFVDPFGEYGDSSSSFVPQTDASSHHPVPDGPLASLYAFIGTGGLRALVVSIFCFCRRCVFSLYLPFVRMGNRIRKI